MRAKQRGTGRACGTRPNRVAPKRRLAKEPLEDRLMLAQTTGLFFHDAEAADGYVLFAPNTANTTYLINKDGEVVNSWDSQYVPGLLGHLLPDGSLIRDASPHGQSGNGFINAAGSGGLLERFDWNGNKTWEFAYDSPQHLAHHDFEIMPNGNILLVAWEYKSEAEATQAGRDPSLPGAGYLYPDHIVEVQPDYVNGGGTIVWEWHIWDHLVQDFAPTKSNYYGPTGVQDNPQLINVNYVSSFSDGGGQAEDWTHANGISYNPDLDQIALSSREFSEFWIIDHSTTTAEAAGHTGGNAGHGGDLLFRWGNPQTYDRGDASDRLLYYQHDVRWIPDGAPGAGDITVFNNGVGRPGTDFSQVVEITPPLQSDGNYTLDTGQAWGPASPTWTYTAPLANFSAIISGAIRLPNGNTFITYGVNGNMTEITPAGQEVWKYVNPYAGDVMLGPEDPIPPLGVPDPLINSLFVNFVFQAQHYPHDYFSQLTSTVAARELFYNNSTFDGNTAEISALDDGAIATDKQAYLPGTLNISTFGNISSYSRGINGVMLDLAGSHGTISADDFTFRMGTNNSPATWLAAPSPTAISVRPGAGESGADRVEIIWDDGAVKNTWLEVTAAANSHTGLVTPDVFYFGNRVGDTGEGASSTIAVTNAVDEISARIHLAFGQSVTNIRDFDRNGLVNADDQIIARTNGGYLYMLSLAPSPVATASASADESHAAVAAALALRDNELPVGQEATTSVSASLILRRADVTSEPRTGAWEVNELVLDKIAGTELRPAESSPDDELLAELAMGQLLER